MSLRGNKMLPVRVDHLQPVAYVLAPLRGFPSNHDSLRSMISQQRVPALSD
jgi:hypothetical protein